MEAFADIVITLWGVVLWIGIAVPPVISLVCIMGLVVNLFGGD